MGDNVIITADVINGNTISVDMVAGAEITGEIAIGAQGYSAYEMWLRNGNTGTVNDYLASLKGDKGDTGDPGVVQALTGGTGVDVDSSDPTSPEISLDSDTQASLLLADSAVQPGDLATVATSGDYDDLTNKPTIPNSLDDLSGDSDDIPEGSTNLYLTSSERTKLSNTSGTNTGDQDLSGLVPNTRTINGDALSSDITLNQDDIGDGTTYKQYSQTEKSKLAGIEENADVTDAANVAAAGAVMTSGNQTVAGNKTFSNKILLPSGSLSQPSLAHSSDIDNGIYFPAAGQMSLVQQGVPIMRFRDGGVGMKGKTNPANAAIYVGNGTGTQTDTQNMVFKGKVDTTPGQSSHDMHHINLNVVEGTLADKKALGYVARIDLNDTTAADARADVVPLWGDVFVHSSSNRNTWGLNTYVQITSDSGYTKAAVGAEIGVHNFNDSHVNGGGALSLRFHGTSDVRYGISMSPEGAGGTYEHAIQVTSNTDKKPRKNLIYYGPLATALQPTGTPLFIVDKDGNVGIKASADTDYSLNVSGDHKTDGDIEITDDTKGVILKSPNGTRFRVTVDDDGSLRTTEL